MTTYANEIATAYEKEQRALAIEANAKLADASAMEILTWAYETYGSKLV